MTERRQGKPRLVVATTDPSTLNAFVLPQLPALTDAGWEIHLVSAPGPLILSPQETVIRHTIPMTRGVSITRDSIALARWHRKLRGIDPAVVLGGTPKAALLAMTSGKLARVPARIYLHRGARWESAAGIERTILMGTDRMTARSATHVIAVSNSLATLLVDESITTDRATVFGAGGSKGVDLTRFFPAPRTATNDRPVIGFLGRLNRDKGLEALLEAFGEVREEFDAVLKIAGDIDLTSPPSDSALRRIRTDANIEWLGATSDSPTFLRGIDILVFPSAREGLPNAVIEAAACGVPTVGWNVTGVCDAVDDPATGFLVPFGDTSQLASAAKSTIRGGHAAYRDACIRWARQFDQEIVTNALVEFLEPLKPSPIHAQLN